MHRISVGESSFSAGYRRLVGLIIIRNTVVKAIDPRTRFGLQFDGNGREMNRIEEH